MSALRLESSYIYQRVMLNFSVEPSRLQSRLPEPWRLEERLGGSNLTVGFCDVLVHLDQEKRPLPTPRYRYVPFNGMATEPSGQLANMRYGTYSDRPEDLGHCLTRGARAVARQHRLFDRDGTTFVEEGYDFALDHGGGLRVQLTYERGTPRRYASAGDGMHVRCPVDPVPEYVYRNEEWQDIVMQRTEGINRLQSLHYEIDAPEFVDLFDGSEQLVSVIAVPWSTRQIFVIEAER